MTFCPSCGAERKEGSKYCHNCGYDFGNVSAELNSNSNSNTTCKTILSEYASATSLSDGD